MAFELQEKANAVKYLLQAYVRNDEAMNTLFKNTNLFCLQFV